jgi:cytochrome c553
LKELERARNAILARDNSKQAVEYVDSKSFRAQILDGLINQMLIEQANQDISIGITRKFLMSKIVKEKKLQDESTMQHWLNTLKAKVEQEIKESATIAKELYTAKCQTCHGTNGEKSAYNSSRPLKDLSAEDMQESIKNYKVGSVNSMNANIMAPYANFIDYKEIKGINAYLKSINNK